MRRPATRRGRFAHGYAAALEGLGDIGDTGIPAVDAIVNDASAKVDRLVLATEVGTVASVVGAVGALLGLVILLQGGRR
jgi:hypothetical protein